MNKYALSIDKSTIWRYEKISLVRKKKKLQKRSWSKRGGKLFRPWWLINTNHHNLCFCCVSPNMRYNHVILTKKSGRGCRQSLLVFLSSNSHKQWWSECFNKELCWTVSAALIYSDVLILFPTFPASTVLPNLIILSLQYHNGDSIWKL